MSRRTNSKREFPEADATYNSHLVSLFISKILKNGKKTLAQKIIAEAFSIIEEKTNTEPLKVFEKAVKNVTPVVEVKATRVGGSTYQVPTEVSIFRGTNLALRWLIRFSRERPGKTIAKKLASELMDASKGLGNAIRKKEETYRMAEANKTYAHNRY